jgi:DNA polymerase-3 subunit gamma/tau
MVRTLRNAFASGRLAHAFILTGVRGVGKTTTARIIARGLNCTGRGEEPTADPCGECENCRAIGEDRHVDVLEMDAASRTGVEDIRELIEGVRYRPVSARYKVYIIDEVHMLSRSAFNALLKTLEEPPAHVRFIFATTEIRKVPVTVLSRCQRFDLRRVETTVLAEHLQAIAGREGATLEPGAAGLLARAADGSVRDGLSLLDQAIALAGGGRVTAESVKAMLGLADRGRILDLFEALLRGKAAEVLALLDDLRAGGADPAVVLQDLLELCHFVTRAKVVPEVLSDPGVPEAERTRGGAIAEAVAMPVLTRCWQMLLKGLAEVQAAPLRAAAAEMALLRLAYASTLPTPGELVGELSVAGDGKSAGAAPETRSAKAPAATAPRSSPAEAGTGGAAAVGRRTEPSGGTPFGDGAPRAALAPHPAAEPEPEPLDSPDAAPEEAMPASFAAVAELARARRDTILAAHLTNDVHIVRFEAGRIEFRPAAHAPRDLAGRLGAFLKEATGRRWVVSVSQDDGAPTLAEAAKTEEARLKAAALDHPLVKAALETFPGARFVARHGAPAAPPGENAAAEPESEDERET